MVCPKSEKEIYLYISGEMAPKAISRFQKHMAACRDCQKVLADSTEVMERLREMKTVRPGKKTRRMILQAAGEARKQEPACRRIRLKWLSDRRSRSRMIREFSLAAAAAGFLIILYLLRFSIFQGTYPDSPAAVAAWQDDFFAQVDWFNQEIERIESGELLVSMTADDEDASPYDEMSLWNDDLRDIRMDMDNILLNMNDI